MRREVRVRILVQTFGEYASSKAAKLIHATGQTDVWIDASHFFESMRTFVGRCRNIDVLDLLQTFSIYSSVIYIT
jgi:hypothetical protein